MASQRIRLSAFLFLLILLLNCVVFGFEFCRKGEWHEFSANRQNINSEYYPFVEYLTHNIGNISLGFDNKGRIFSVRFPSNSRHYYLGFGGLWVGAVIGIDTVVSDATGLSVYEGNTSFLMNGEFWPDPYPEGEVEIRSIDPASPYFSEEAKSEQDYFCVYTDTVTNTDLTYIDTYDGRPHYPLGIEVTQKSFSWSYDYAGDFIIFDYSIKNIGDNYLRDTYIGLYFDLDAFSVSGSQYIPYDPANDDLCGMIDVFPSEDPCFPDDTVNMIYTIDNDGFPSEAGIFNRLSPVGAIGIRLLRTPSDSLRFSFNWWVSGYDDPEQNFGPRYGSTEDNPFRNMNGYLGTPSGDKNKYYVMRNGEMDYDQMVTGMDHLGEGWLPRPKNALDIADGHDPEILLSFGPFNIRPGQALPFSYAIICGEKVHTDPENFAQNFRHDNPFLFFNNLDFSDLARNARWAMRIYDNPGYDSNDDGYHGKSYICCTDSTIADDGTVTCDRYRQIFYEGDGIPDFRAASPPPPPVVRVIPGVDKFNHGVLTVRWNGYESELTADPFTGEPDFEGYRVHLSMVPYKSGFSVAASYDLEDYTRWTWDDFYEEWVIKERPFTLDSLRELYGEYFNPLFYSIDVPMTVFDDNGEMKLYYFVRQDWNTSDLRNPDGIHKRFPDQPYPTTLILDTAKIYYPEELTDEGYFKYFEYEYVFRNLLPSQMYYVSVTAFDYGSAGAGIGALETNPTVNMVSAYPQHTASYVENSSLRVIVYPNPYRVDGNYRAIGYEGRGEEDKYIDRVRRIHFANLPHKCTIRIFSIDGDLIRQIHHDYPPDDPHSSHDAWDMITRNTQAPVSGIYYFSVSSDYGHQVGKFVIIK